MSYKIVDEITAEIFRAYDIRGIVDDTFTADNIYTIGLAIGSELLERGIEQVAVGRDGRVSGPVLVKALIDGIATSGCGVIDIGMVTTPILYYVATNIYSQSGVMLSGSHNPPNYNGIKMVVGGNACYGDDILGLRRRILEQRFNFGKAIVEKTTVINQYFERVVDDVRISRPLKVVVDCGNGIGGKVVPELFKKMGLEVIELYCEVDGNFPNHQPDPADPENLKDLIVAIKENKADVGLAFDGDADRVGVVTEQGEIIAADRLLALLSKDLLSRYPGETIIFDVKCSQHLPAEITKYGGVPLMYKTGHSLVKAKMKELEVLLAGELSGHIFMKERWYGFDDGVYVGARFLELLSNHPGKCSELFDEISKGVNTPELKLPIVEDEKFKFMEKLVSESVFPGGEVSQIDGIRVDYDYGFGLVRPSNTSPYLILRFEGNSRESLLKIRDIFKSALSKIDASLDFSILGNI